MLFLIYITNWAREKLFMYGQFVRYSVLLLAMTLSTLF